MSGLEWVDEVQEIVVGGGPNSEEEMKRVNQALSQGWHLLAVHPCYSGDPQVGGAIGTAYVLGRGERPPIQTTTLPGQGASGVQFSPAR